MAYFTTVLQRQVNNTWRRKIEQADSEMRLYTTGKEIRDYLNDHKTLCTAGFVIRRHIQTSNPGLLDLIRARTGSAYVDLSANLNLPWADVFLEELAKDLARISKSRGITISRTTWASYLKDAPIKMYKNTPFKVAFALSMDIETTDNLLMACGQSPYCFRKPEHFIYYYCQSRPSSFSWKHAQDLINAYRNGLAQDSYTANHASRGMTRQLQSDLALLFNNPAPDRQADEQLIAYMLLHQKEFSGLSLTARKDFLRMADYLAILYPTYSKVTSTKEAGTGDVLEETLECPVSVMPDGTPNLSELTRALFSTGGWLPTTVGRYTSDAVKKKLRTASSLKRREFGQQIEYKRAEINVEEDRPFLTSIQFFVDSYAHHLDAIERIYRRPANPDNVERRDIILFTYFFIRRYPEYLADEEYYGETLDRLTSLVYNDDRIDSCMDQLMEELYTITAKETEQTLAGAFDPGADAADYLNLFNLVLKHFGMKGMYMPNPWDRFIIMSLFAEDPDFFTEAVLWNTIADDEEDILPASPKNDTPKRPSSPLPTADQLVSVSLIVNHPQSVPFLPVGNGRIQPLTVTLFRERTGEHIIINKNCFIIGRLSSPAGRTSADYGIVTENKYISRSHAAILFDRGSFYLADISSRNETLLNQKPLKGCSLQATDMDSIHVSHAYPLKNRDVIQIGEDSFSFLA